MHHLILSSMIQTKVQASHFLSRQVDFPITRLDGQVMFDS